MRSGDKRISRTRGLSLSVSLPVSHFQTISKTNTSAAAHGVTCIIEDALIRRGGQVLVRGPDNVELVGLVSIMGRAETDDDGRGQ